MADKLSRLVATFMNTSIIARNMREPGTGVLGRLARGMMERNNRLSAQDAARRLEISAGHCVLELGPGSGWAWPEIGKTNPSRLIGVEISERFRHELAQLAPSLPLRPEIHDTDAIDMRSFLHDNAVDRLLAVNVVYFLNPLPAYVAELARVLKPGGRGLLAGKFLAVADAQSEIFVNTDPDAIIECFAAGGFSVKSEEIDLGSPARSYTALHLERKN
jgi:cyclopropane fatty-acyl-phospholipid synthase-like methyltransferase